MKYYKRLLFSAIFSVIIATVVLYINVVLLNNPLFQVFDISLFIFIDIMIGWISYFFVMDIYSYRWRELDSSGMNSYKFIFDPKKPNIGNKFEMLLENLETMKLHDENFQNIGNYRILSKRKIDNKIIERNGLKIECEILLPTNKNIMKKTIIIFSHGFNKAMKNSYEITSPLCKMGYIIFHYNPRGVNVPDRYSKKNSKKNDFISNIEDFQNILKSILDNNYLKNYSINVVGESLGAICVVNSFKNIKVLKRIDSIVLISMNAIFNTIFPKHSFFFSKVWFKKANYCIKGVDLFPKNEINKKLSPNLLLKDILMNKLFQNALNEKILLIHSKSDKLFDFDNYLKNKKILEQINHNSVIFNKGGHNQIKNELQIISILDNFINSRKM